MKNSKVSIIIPTYNEENCIEKCIISLFQQSYKEYEIIIVDDGSIDKTLDIVKSFTQKSKKVKLIKGEHKGPGFSRNLGAKKSSGKILVFVDADMEFDKNYINNLVSPIILDKALNGTTHSYEIATNVNNIWSKLWGRIRVQRLPNQKEDYSSDLVIFRAIKKVVFDKLGGFDQKYGYADDQTFWIKYKLLPYIAKGTVCYHKNPETLKEVYKQSIWIGASIENKILKFKILKFIAPLFLILFSPLIIIFLSIKKCYRNKYLKLLPWMLIFISVRYFGTTQGIFNKIYLNKNIK